MRHDLANSVFVSVPAYSDPDIAHTVDSLIRSASGKNYVNIGVCEQVTEYMAAWSVGRTGIPAHCSVRYQSYEDGLIGVGGARASVEKMYDGESHILMIDSHTRLQADWDEWLLESLQVLPTQGVITGLMPNNPWDGTGTTPVTNCKELDETGIPLPTAIMLTRPRHTLYPARHVYAGSLFGPSWLGSVAYDPSIMFHGEEQTMAARLWTSGYDLYHMAMPVMHGATRLPDRPWEKTGWYEKNDLSIRRCRALLGIIDRDPTDPALADLGKYGMGTERSLGDWEEYSGFNYRAGTFVAEWGEWGD